MVKPLTALLSEVSAFFLRDLSWYQVFIAFYVPGAFLLGWQIGITPSSGVGYPFLLSVYLLWGLLLNELALFLIGDQLLPLLATPICLSNQGAIDCH